MPLEFPTFISNYFSLISSKKSVKQSSHFAAQVTPKISIQKYLERIYKFFQCSEQCYVLAAIYIERISEFIELNSLNIHRLLIISLLVAAKFFDDKYFENAYYAKVGGIKNSELNYLENLFLRLIKFKLFVTQEEYEKYQQVIFNTSECGYSQNSVNK